MVKEDLTFQEQANNTDKEKNKMSILVYSRNDLNKEEEDEFLKKSKYIICPKCKESARISVDNYKLGLYDCKNGP